MAKDNGAVRAEPIKTAFPTRCPKCGATVFRMAQTGNVIDGRFVVTATDAVCTICNTVIETSGA